MQELQQAIRALCHERRAVILAHTYQSAEIQDVADFVGDSYGLSVKATQIEDAEVIVFCGVSFMAETAAILNPGKTVIMPDATAGCAMAEMISGAQLRAFKAEHPGAPVVCYVNSTAEVKAESDICCTSSNAVKVVQSLGDVPEVLFVPDQYLGAHVAKKLGYGWCCNGRCRDAQAPRKLVCWDGGCPVHFRLTAGTVAAMKAQYPGYEVMTHPETTPEVQAAADHVLATGPMIELVKKAANDKWLVGTEEGIMHALKQAAPQKSFVHLWPELVCPGMKQTNLTNLRQALETLTTRITVPEDIAVRARKSIQAMLDVSR